MTDIVKRLRDADRRGGLGYEAHETIQLAGAEITLLRAQLAEADKDIDILWPPFVERVKNLSGVTIEPKGTPPNIAAARARHAARTKETPDV